MENFPNDQFKILKEIKNWQALYSGTSGQSQVEKGTGGTTGSREQTITQSIYEMIDAFGKFCEEYINELSNPAKVQESKLPQDWLVDSGDFSLLEYWEPILRAAEQYQIEHYRHLLDDGYEKLSKFGDSLQKRVNLGAYPPIILYFEKVGKYKRYPFGNIYLIGVPLLDGYDGDWWAMAHELGHHVYWNSSFSENKNSTLLVRGINFFDQEIAKSLEALKADGAEKRNIRDILEAWTEEIFADVIGARIAGEEYVDAAWQRIFKKVEKAEDLFVSDKDHPFLYFLPYIRAYALGSEVVNDKSKWGRFGNIPQELENGIRIANLRTALKGYVEGMNKKIDNITFANWVSSSSALDQLKKFIGKNPRSIKPEEFIKLLLKPRIIEEGDSWTCKNGHTNNSGVWPCAVCGAWW